MPYQARASVVKRGTHASRLLLTLAVRPRSMLSSGLAAPHAAALRRLRFFEKNPTPEALQLLIAGLQQSLPHLGGEVCALMLASRMQSPLDVGCAAGTGLLRGCRRGVGSRSSMLTHGLAACIGSMRP